MEAITTNHFINGDDHDQLFEKLLVCIVDRSFSMDWLFPRGPS